MAETMRVVLNSFWSWLGTFLIVAVIAQGLGGFVNRALISERRADGSERADTDGR
jgi:hypothetical protein